METTHPTRSLPPPRTDGSMALEAALAARRTIRELQPHDLTDHEIGQLLWAAQGVTDESGRRTAPSASRTYPLELTVVTASGVERYLPAGHALERRDDADLRAELREATGDQEFVGSAPLLVVVSAVSSRAAPRHGPERAIRYAQFEAGHAGQNLLLQAVALDLAAVPIGSFEDARISRLLGLPVEEAPLYLFAIGRPR